MDPNATLEEIRAGIKAWAKNSAESLERINELREDDNWSKADEYLGYLETDAYHELESLQAQFEALDDWIVGGGFLPADWTFHTEA